MFLSKVILNPRDKITYNLVPDIYNQHRFIMSSFPDHFEQDPSAAGSQASQGVLYRLESISKMNSPYFLVQSEKKPDWNKTQALHKTEICCMISNEWAPSFMVGSSYRFRIRANPTICCVRRGENGVRQKSVRKGLFSEEEQETWLEHVGNTSGFKLRSAITIRSLGKCTGYQTAKQQDQKKRTITCYMVDFDGTLKITDPLQFTDAYRRGIGRGKAWGCGLISLAKI